MSKRCLKCDAENAEGARFCRQCGAPFEPAATAATATAGPAPGADHGPGLAGAFRPAPRRPPLALWATLAALLIALIVGGAWWFVSASAVPGPSFDAAPPPSFGASGAPPGAPSANDASAGTAPVSAVPTAPPDPVAASVPTLDPAPPAAATALQPLPAAPMNPPPGAASGTGAAVERPVGNVKPLRASSAQRPAPAARDPVYPPRAGADGTSPLPPGAVAPGVRTPASAARSVQERCGNENVLLRSLCEARECFKREHAGEPACLRIKAADERRLQREDRGGR